MGIYMDRIRADRERRCRAVMRATAPPGKTFRPEKKAAVASGPKFREETPKKGCDKATPSPYRTAKYRRCLFLRQA
jgi:hypothetical protein